MNSLNEIFAVALNIKKPWFIKDINFDMNIKRLGIHVDFVKRSTFACKQDGITGQHKAYDTVKKEWRHLNFFQYECYLVARVPRIKTPDGYNTSIP